MHITLPTASNNAIPVCALVSIADAADRSTNDATVARPANLRRLASGALAVVCLSLVGTACGSLAGNAGPTSTEPGALASNERPVIVDPPERESAGSISIKALRLGRIGFDSPLMSEVGFSIESIDTDVDPIAGQTDAEDATRYELSPGDYMVVVDRGDLGPGPCDGSYEMSISVRADQEASVTAYSVEDGVEQIALPPCMSVATVPMLDRLPVPCPEEPLVRTVDAPMASD